LTLLVITRLLDEIMILPVVRFKSSFICQGTSTRRQRSDLCGLRFKLLPVTSRQNTKVPCPRTQQKQSCWTI